MKKIKTKEHIEALLELLRIEEVAYRLGVSWRTVYRWRHGKNKPQRAHSAQIEKLFKTL